MIDVRRGPWDAHMEHLLDSLETCEILHPPMSLSQVVCLILRYRVMNPQRDL